MRTRRRGPRRATEGLAVVAVLLAALASGPARAEGPRWSGEVYTAVDVLLHSCGNSGGCELPNYLNRNVFKLAIDADLGEHAAVRAEVALHNTNEAEVERTDDIHDADKVLPLSVRLGDAWIEGYGVLPGLDFRIGSQRVRWGSGDGFSPTDRLNPVDLEDPLYFDRRLAKPAVHLAYQLGDVTISSTWFPFFMPSLMPRNVFDVAGTDAAESSLDSDDIVGDLPTIRNVTSRFDLPEQSLSESSVGARVEWAGPWADVAVGYYFGRDSLPQIAGEVIPENYFSGNETDLLVTLGYPRLQMIAAEARAPTVAGISLWVDAAFVLPERTVGFVSQSRLEDLERLNAIDEAPDHDVETVVQTGDPYLSSVVGGDVTLADFVYLNLQYVHGFLFERNPDDLHHYAFALVRLPSDDSAVAFEVRGGVEAAPGFDAFGWLAQVRVSVLFSDSVKIGALGVMQDGDAGTTLKMFRTLSEARLEAQARF